MVSQLVVEPLHAHPCIIPQQTPNPKLVPACAIISVRGATNAETRNVIAGADIVIEPSGMSGDSMV